MRLATRTEKILRLCGREMEGKRGTACKIRSAICKELYNTDKTIKDGKYNTYFIIQIWQEIKSDNRYIRL